MKISLFENLKKEVDRNNPFSDLFILDNGDSFYVEPIFYTQLEAFASLRKERFSEIPKYMLSLVQKNHHVVFTGCFDNPLTKVDGFIYLEITDVTDPLKIYVEDKSRGSDYGD